MQRTLVLKLFTDKQTGSLAMSVTHAETDGEEGALDKHSLSATDTWASDAALKEAAGRAVVDYLARLKADAKKSISPIEKASRG